MIKLYDGAFSPFARKVRMVLDYKGLNYRSRASYGRRHQVYRAGRADVCSRQSTQRSHSLALFQSRDCD